MTKSMSAKMPRAIRVQTVTHFNRPRKFFYRIWRAEPDGITGKWWGGANGWVSPSQDEHDNVIEYRSLSEAQRVAAGLRRFEYHRSVSNDLRPAARRLALDAGISANQALAVLEECIKKEASE